MVKQSTMLALSFLVELLFVFLFPLALGAWLHKRFRVSWLLFAAGAITFGLSQAVHLPLNQGVFVLFGGPETWPRWTTALVLGMTAGICEETARYAAYRWVLRDLRQWRQALMFGAGHGGIESILFVGLAVGAVLLNMMILQGTDLEAWGLPPSQTAQMQQQLTAYWAQDWTAPLLAATERLFSITFHVGMAVLVLQAVTRHYLGYWLLAVGLHTGVNALALITVDAGWPLAATEGLIGLFGIAALTIVLGFRPKAEELSQDRTARDPSSPSLSTIPTRPPTPEERLRKQIEESKYER